MGAALSDTKKHKAASVDSSDVESSSDDEDPNERRGLLDDSHLLTRWLKTTIEFRKRYRYNIPMFQQPSDSVCVTFTPTGVNSPKKLRKAHSKRTIAFSPLSEVSVILEQRPREALQPQLDTSGNALAMFLTRRLRTPLRSSRNNRRLAIFRRQGRASSRT